MKSVTLMLLVLAVAGLSGCQTLKAHNPFRHRGPAYKTAQQEQPLEVPPGMNQPPTTEALVIPGEAQPGSATGTAAAAQQAAAAPPPTAGASPVAAGGDSLTLSDTPASTYHRVGLALARGDIGQVTAHDDTALTYEVAVDTVVKSKPDGGFFHRLFHRSQSKNVKGTVTVSIAPSGSGSVVQASGNPDAAARVIAMLQQRLK